MWAEEIQGLIPFLEIIYQTFNSLENVETNRFTIQMSQTMLTTYIILFIITMEVKYLTVAAVKSAPKIWRQSITTGSRE